MNFLADLYTPCDACHGARYNRETLEVTWRGKSIAAALAQTVDEALAFFAPIPGAAAILQALHDLGLGYLPLDRSVTTLSGGEAQRIKIASYLAKAAPKRGRKEGERLLFVLDEPTTGLHFREVDMLLRSLYRLRAAGHTILCIEHHSGMLSRADYSVVLGPGAGADGGRIIFSGVPRK
jgi:excinuclease ABC subunit A